MDTKTLIVTIILVAGALALVIVGVAAHRRERHLSLYAAGFVSGMVSFLLFLGQGTWTPWISIVLANLLIVGYHLGLGMGLRSWGGHSHPWPHRYTGYFLVWLVGLVIFTFVWNSYAIRAIGFSLLVSFITADILLDLGRSTRTVPKALLRATWVVGIGLISNHAVRLVLIGGQPADVSFLANNAVSTYTFCFTIFFSILWAGLILALDAASLLQNLQHKNELLAALATTDELTGLSNRHQLETVLLSEMERSSRYQQPLTMVMLDLDHFKLVNDNWGHATGDEVLKKTAQVLRGQVRGPDSLFRWGGEEFVVLAPHTKLEGGIQLAEKIRLALAEAPFPTVGRVTGSLGVAEWTPSESREQWFKKTDHALYRAKSSGRNRVIAWMPEDVLPVALVRMEWQSEWESGNSELDGEHQELLDMANSVLDLSLSNSGSALGAQLEHLLAHIGNHFAHEEEILRSVGYPETEHHSELHRQLVLEALTIRDDFLTGKTDVTHFFNFLVGKVVIGHLLTADVRFFPYTRAVNRASTSRS